MRRWGVIGSIVAGVLLAQTQAAACDTDWCDQYWDAGSEGERSVPLALSADDSPTTAASQAAALGLYEVTQVWAGDYTTTQGDTTTYGSNAVDLQAGTFARQVAVIATGESSPLDGLSMNARMTLSDGRETAGAFYETFACDAATCRSLGYTYFADDSETRHASAPPPSSVPSDPLVLLPPPPVAVPPPPSYTPLATTPSFVEGPRDIADPSDGPLSLVVPIAAPSALARRDVRAGVALAPQGDMLGSVEVLRGRRVALWIRATVDGVPATVVSWSLASGDVVALGALAGAGDEPFLAVWESLAPRGSAFAVRFTATVGLGAGGVAVTDASLAVVVRSPALVR